MYEANKMLYPSQYVALSLLLNIKKVLNIS